MTPEKCWKVGISNVGFRAVGSADTPSLLTTSKSAGQSVATILRQQTADNTPCWKLPTFQPLRIDAQDRPEHLRPAKHSRQRWADNDMRPRPSRTSADGDVMTARDLLDRIDHPLTASRRSTRRRHRRLATSDLLALAADLDRATRGLQRATADIHAGTQHLRQADAAIEEAGGGPKVRALCAHEHPHSALRTAGHRAGFMKGGV